MVPSGRQTWQGCPTKNLDAFLVLSIQRLDVGAFARQTISTVSFHNTEDGETGLITVGHHPPICLPDVNARDQTPRPSPAVFTCWQLEWPGNEATKTLCCMVWKPHFEALFWG